MEEYIMPKIKYHVRFPKLNAKTLLDMVFKGSTSAKAIMHANVLLIADENNSKGRKSEAAIASLFHVNQQTVPYHSTTIFGKKVWLLRLAGKKKRYSTCCTQR